MIEAETKVVKPAAGPETLYFELLKMATINPPKIPDKIPEKP